jgi:hypothetical protein
MTRAKRRAVAMAVQEAVVAVTSSAPLIVATALRATHLLRVSLCVFLRMSLRMLMRGFAGGLLLLMFSSAQATVLPDERIDVLYHSYEGGGTQIDGPAILVRKSLGTSVSISGQYYVDSISGASIDVLAARGEDVDLESGATPYAEERKQYDLGLVYLNDRTTINLGYSTSKENDFDGTTYSFGISQAFFGDLTTIGLTTSFGQDVISRNDQPEFGEREAERRRYGLSITQIVTKNLIASLSFESAADEGFLQNPYRVMRFCTSDYGDDDANPVCSESNDAAEVYPATHNSDAIGLRAIYYLPYRAALRVDYRDFVDSWGIEASNYEVRYTHPYNQWLFEIKYRAYEQTAADFYRDLFPYANYQNFMGRDKELGPMTNTTIGVGATYELPKGFVPGFEKSTINLYWDRIQFDYEDFRNVLARENGTFPGQEPLYQFDADVIRLYFSFWF